MAKNRLSCDSVIRKSLSRSNCRVCGCALLYIGHGKPRQICDPCKKKCCVAKSKTKKVRDAACIECGLSINSSKRGPLAKRCSDCKKQRERTRSRAARSTSNGGLKKKEIIANCPASYARKAAMSQGLIRYFPGTPCSKGHVGERYVNSNQCIECAGNKGTGGNETNGARERRRQARRLALQAGTSRFFTGDPCINGHICDRYTKNNVCVECASQRQQDRRAKRKIEKGGVTYVSSEPCKNGHVGERYSATDECVQCRRIDGAYRRQSNIEAERVRDKLRRSKNKDKERTRSANRRAHRKRSIGNLTPGDVATMYAEQKGCCFWCGISVDDTFHRDHIVPISKGGSNVRSNIVLSCAVCNSRKQDKCPDVWAEQILSEIINGTAPFPWQTPASHQTVVGTLASLCHSANVSFDDAYCHLLSPP